MMKQNEQATGIYGYEKSPDYGNPPFAIDGEYRKRGLKAVRIALFSILVMSAVFIWAVVSLRAESQDIRVIDPDTVAFSQLDAPLRLVNVDGPEKGGRAKCEQERELEKLGTAYARQLIAEGTEVKPILLTPPRRDRYERHLGNIEIDGRDYSQMMIAAGYLRRWDYGREPKPKWCD